MISVESDPLRSSEFRWGSVVVLGVLSVLFTDEPIGIFILLLVLFGFWNLAYLFIIPRTRLGGGMLLLLLSLLMFAGALSEWWLAIAGGFLFVHGNYLAFTSAARLHQ